MCVFKVEVLAERDVIKYMKYYNDHFNSEDVRVTLQISPYCFLLYDLT